MNAKQISLAIMLSAGGTLAQEPPRVTFGTTVVSSSGFEGRIYFLKKDTDFLPKLDRMRSVGTIYTPVINVPAQHFKVGFPGVTDRFEWFGILYTAKFWVEKEGRYSFAVLSDDGSQLRVDRKMVIDNDGQHGPEKLEASAILTRGIHELSLSYFQGPEPLVALQLFIMAPDAEWKLLNTADFPTPTGTMQLEAGKIHSIKSASNFRQEAPLRPLRP